MCLCECVLEGDQRMLLETSKVASTATTSSKLLEDHTSLYRRRFDPADFG